MPCLSSICCPCITLLHRFPCAHDVAMSTKPYRLDFSRMVGGPPIKWVLYRRENGWPTYYAEGRSQDIWTFSADSPWYATIWLDEKELEKFPEIVMHLMEPA